MIMSSLSSSSALHHHHLILTAMVALQALLCSQELAGVYGGNYYQNNGGLMNSQGSRIKKANDSNPAGGCKSIDTEIQVSKEEKVASTGQLVRVCEGVVRVAKCEGVCSSRLRPWINSPSGFLKECKCCREGAMTEKVVRLAVCFDAAGRRLEGQSLEITIAEPKQCGCFQCA